MPPPNIRVVAAMQFVREGETPMPPPNVRDARYPELDAIVESVNGKCWLARVPPRSKVATRCASSNRFLRAETRLDAGDAEYAVRVADNVVAGPVFVFDPSFEHERWFDGEEEAVLLSCEVAHPEAAAGN